MHLNSSTSVSMKMLNAPAQTHSETVLATWNAHPPSLGYHLVGSSPIIMHNTDKNT